MTSPRSRDGNVTAGSFLDWIEVPASQFTRNVFELMCSTLSKLQLEAAGV